MKKIYILLLLVCVTALSNAQEEFEYLQELTAPNRVKMDHFGFSVAASGNYAIVGARYKDKDPTKNYTEEGAAYIYEKDVDGKWKLAQKLEASDAVSGRGFGKVVDLFGDYAVVGDHFGYTYIYERSFDRVWKEKKKLPRHGGKYKYVSLSNNWLAVGQDYKKKGNTKFYNGSVHLYKRDSLGNWDKTQKITLLDTLNENHFGLEVSISEKHLFVRSDANVYIYSLAIDGQWSNVPHQVLPIGLPVGVGHSLSTIKVNDNTAVIGMHSLSNQVNLGNVHVYKLSPVNNKWALQKTLVAFDSVGAGVRDFGFGYAVDLSGKHILVGSNSTGSLEKKAYVFHQTDSGWVPKQKITLDDSTALNFGNTVAIAGNDFFVAAERQGADSVEASTPEEPYRAGKVYVYGDPTPPSCITVTIPDSKFEQTLLDLRIDSTDGRLNGTICKVDAEAVERLDISNRNIDSLDGIAAFTNLEVFYCSGNNIKELNLSLNKKLKDLHCGGNNVLTKVNIQNGNNTILNHFEAKKNPVLTCIQVDSIEYAEDANWYKDSIANYNLDCDKVLCDPVLIPDPVFEARLIKLGIDRDGIVNGQICRQDAEKEIRLGVSGKNQINKIKDLKGISSFINLEHLYCEGNDLTILDLKTNVALRSLICRDNSLTTLDLSENTALQTLWCQVNELATLELSNNNVLRSLDCSRNELTTLDLSANRILQNLSCNNNMLTILELSGDSVLESLNCSHNDITTLDLSANRIQNLSCNNNMLTILELSGDSVLESLNCSRNELTTLDLSANRILRNLSCNNNMLTILELSSDSVLESLNCSHNDLTTLDLSKNNVLGYLNCSHNDLTTLDLSKNNVLGSLNCSHNDLTTLDLSKNNVLGSLSCSHNDLTTLDLKTNTALELLNCSSNQLETLDLKTNTVLKRLYCSDNELDNLVLKANIVLHTLNCSKNQLDTLNLSANYKLTEVICQSNQSLKLLNLQNDSNTILDTLNVRFNDSLTCIQVDDTVYANQQLGNGWYKDTTAKFNLNCPTFSPSPNQSKANHNPTDNIIVYPNPVTKGQLFINTSQEIQQVVIYNMKGEEVFTSNTNLKQIDVAGLDRGFYMVKITLVDEVVNKKVVVE